MLMISLFVSFMPSFPSRAIFRIVFSIPFTTIPSPPLNSCPFRYIWNPRMPASTEDAIFAAQDAFAPSQTMPETMASALTTV